MKFKIYGNCKECHHKFTCECTDNILGGCSGWKQMGRYLTSDQFMKKVKENNYKIVDTHIISGGILYSYKKQNDNLTYYEECRWK